MGVPVAPHRLEPPTGAGKRVPRRALPAQRSQSVLSAPEVDVQASLEAGDGSARSRISARYLPGGRCRDMAPFSQGVPVPA